MFYKRIAARSHHHNHIHHQSHLIQTHRTLLFAGFCVFSLVYLYLANQPTGLRSHRAVNLRRRVDTRFVNEITERRLNLLLANLQQRERLIQPDLQSKLGLLSFEEIRNLKLTQFEHEHDYFPTELKRFLKLDRTNTTIQVTSEFVDYLRNVSNFFSFKKPRNEFVIEPIRNVSRRPAILIAADFKYFSPVIDALTQIRKYLPDYPLVVYDLGLYSSYMIEQVTYFTQLLSL